MRTSDGPGLFDESEADEVERRDAPLAERLRLRTLDEFVGQAHVVGPGRILRRLLEGGGRLPSIILWGPPGTGKTTLARLLARHVDARFVALSAVLSGVKDLREAIHAAETALRRGRRTILFIDEIHRFNKAQQDALLHAVEDGTVTLVGATTENPSFEVIGALLSRARVISLEALATDDLEKLIDRALSDDARGLAAIKPSLSRSLRQKLAVAAGGDARVALSALEEAAQATNVGPNGVREIAEESLVEALGRARYAYDKQGEEHYNLISALIKSVRNSNVDGALYWLARLVAGGADPLYIARRLCILASEDVGLADPQAMVQAAAAAQITHLIGFPEALFPLTQATIYVARAPKSNGVLRAFAAASSDAEATAREPVPMHLRNAVTPLMKATGYGEGYRYIHDDATAREEMECLPEALQGKRYYQADEQVSADSIRGRRAPDTTRPDRSS
jgi:putative ATPase